MLLSSCESVNEDTPVTEKPYAACAVSVEEVTQTKQQANAGDAEAQIQLGEWYRYGRCVPKDFSEAVSWYELAAEQGRLDTQKTLAYIYRFLLKDMSSAVVWYQKVADSGDSEAARTLGYIYYFGDGVEKDIDEAVKWLTLAAERGDLSSQVRLEEIFKERELQRLANERRLPAFDRFGTISIVWLPIDPEFLKEKSSVTSHSEASDAEARGYLYAPIALVSWPAWLLTAAVGEAGVAAKKSAEHTYMQNTVRKIFEESHIQTIFIENLLDAANQQLDNPVTVLEKPEETQNYSDEIGVDTILELKNGLVKIIAKTHHFYDVLVEVEYKLIDNETQNVIDKKTIEARGETFTVSRSSVSDEEEDSDTKLARQSVEVAYQKLANRIIEDVLTLP